MLATELDRVAVVTEITVVPVLDKWNPPPLF